MLDSYLESQLRSFTSLNKQQILAFGLSCCERFLPTFEAFTLMEKWGDVEVLRDAVDYLWQSVLGARLKPLETRRRIRECANQVPGLNDNFWSIFHNTAFNTATSVVYTLKFSINGNIDEIRKVSRSSLASVENYLYAVNDLYAIDVGLMLEDEILGENIFDIDKFSMMRSNLSQLVANAPLYLAEMDKQKSDLNSISESLSTEKVEKLRMSAQYFGLQPFSRGIVKK